MKKHHPILQKYFRELCRKAGSTITPKKSAASRRNGLKGGRPKGTKNKKKA